MLAPAVRAGTRVGGRGNWVARGAAAAGFRRADFARAFHASARASASDDGLDWSASARPVRNVSIIAHVDHGKTTLADRLLEAAGEWSQAERALDSNDLERERGITILSKVTGFGWRDPSGAAPDGLRIQLVDTPGHADFGGEVERVLHMVDSALLVVDAREGPMPQTRYVLRKALKHGLRPIVVFNKADREDARIGEVETEVFDLFDALGASEEQLDFPMLYSSARDGWATDDPDLGGRDRGMEPLLDLLAGHCPPPKVLPTPAFRMLVTQIDVDPYVGKLARGKVASGAVRVGDEVTLLSRDGEEKGTGRVTRLTTRVGTGSIAVEEGVAGDIIEVAGAEAARPTDTILATQAAWEKVVNIAGATTSPSSIWGPLPTDPIDPPTLSMTFGVNDSPLAGKDGDKLTAPLLARRLDREAESNVALALAPAPPADGMPDAVEVFGRGELQLAVLIETLRREGFELSISPPRVVVKELTVAQVAELNRAGRDGEDGEDLDDELSHLPRDAVVKVEPWEELVLEVPEAAAGSLIQRLSTRRGELKDYVPAGTDTVRLTFAAPSRSLLGFQSEFRQDTRGEGIMTRTLSHWGKSSAGAGVPRKGALISSAAGATTAYALASLEARGILFVAPGEDTYPGMVIGEHSRDKDLEVNPVRAKKLTNIRAAGSDDLVQLTPPRKMPLEEAIGWVQQDELLEVTPSAIRIRKRILDPSRRKVATRNA